MTHEELVQAVSVLQDRQAINDCLMNYSRGVDRMDRELLLSVYHEDAIDDHGVFVGNREQFVDWVLDRGATAYMSQQHCIFNVSVDLQADVAHTETYYMFVGLRKKGEEAFAMSGGRYIDRFEKRNGRWAIAARVCVRDWRPVSKILEKFDQSALTAVLLDERTRKLIDTGSQVAKDRTDPSYQRPLQIDPARLSM